MNKSKGVSNNYHFIFYSLVFVAGIWLGVIIYTGRSSSEHKKQHQTDIDISKITDIFRFIDDNYVDTVDYNKLTDDALSCILLHLDPHSTYISAEEFQLMSEQISGKFEGIGIQFRIVKDTVYVVHTISNGPSEKVGIKAGDRIIEVDEEKIAGINITNNDVLKMLRGKKGTKVTVGIKRSGVSNILPFTIIRDVIPTQSIDFIGMLSKNIGYIKLSTFNEKSDTEFNNALNILKQRGMENLIFDLRGNSGGSLKTCLNIIDNFFEKDILLVYTEGLHRPKEEYRATHRGLFKTGNLVILVDEFSASASEIVAGAIQDHDRGIILGRRTFGKGLVQEQISFRDGSAIRLTVARYYTPAGRSIQRKYKKNTETYYDEFYNKITDEFLTGTDTTSYDTVPYLTKSGKTVYGGGGIMPDININYPDIYKNENVVLYFSVLFQFAFEYVDKNREYLLKKYNNSNTFINNFRISASLWQEYLDFIAANSVSTKDIYSITIKQAEKEFIEIHLKANIGRNLFGSECYYPIIKDTDEMLKEAIKYISNYY